MAKDLREVGAEHEHAVGTVSRAVTGKAGRCFTGSFVRIGDRVLVVIDASVRVRPIPLEMDAVIGLGAFGGSTRDHRLRGQIAIKTRWRGLAATPKGKEEKAARPHTSTPAQNLHQTRTPFEPVP